jgi:lipopolysaccharide/colanic/teichoic acid biosynthesis glycosyltransferase
VFVTGWYVRWGKRALDLCLVVASLPVALPLGLVAALLVRLKMGRGVLFRQIRPGKGGRPFEILKFRTMRDLRGVDGELLRDGERLTWFGRILRSTSLDELPELWNVIRGEMSLVGPRPLLVAYLDRYTAEQARRHEALPGITGWAQVNGRNAMTWEDKFRFDVWYVDHASLVVDVGIIARTVWQVVRRQGIAAEGFATMPEFGVQESGEPRKTGDA